MKERVCSVCDCFHRIDRMKFMRVHENSNLLRVMKVRLRSQPNLPPGLQNCYDASDLNGALGGILLSRAGIIEFEGKVKLQICIPCKTSLLDKKRAHPPKFAIANGLWMGRVPAIFEDSTFTENAMLKLSQPMHYISVVRGGKHSSLRSHAYFFRAEPAPPAQILPRDVVTQGLIGVTIVRAMTPEQQATTLKQYDVRVSRLQDQLDWYKKNNHLYANIEEYADWESSIPTRVVKKQIPTNLLRYMKLLRPAPRLGLVVYHIQKSGKNLPQITPIEQFLACKMLK
ncbi:Hypothetical protein PHPALM_34 [Phytophthora palmivora]|uniref:DUF6570 domain-containing protein n=1 Tax=Phytophthora palmivora TaxID=4796 RepID=A0A2P4YVV5_9STRA|nr:Hypothetical protein PHPALM_34 [Phytophthora palmivora]